MCEHDYSILIGEQQQEKTFAYWFHIQEADTCASYCIVYLGYLCESLYGILMHYFKAKEQVMAPVCVQPMYSFLAASLSLVNHYY